MEYEFDEKAE
jgi:midasin